jgi:hypothetical protein
LRDRADDMKEKLTAGGCRINALGVADEIDPQGTELVQAFNEVLQRAGESIEFPDKDDIEESRLRASFFNASN